QRGGVASHGQLPMQGRPPTVRPRPRPPTRGRLAVVKANPKGRPAPPVGTTACSTTPAKGAGCRAPTRGCSPWSALPPAGATALAAGVAAPWLGGC
ncbi:hypothetical protein GW17_00056108, partial [Ensete ventricosum]